MKSPIARTCPDCNAQVARMTTETGEDGKHGLYLKGRSFRLFGNRVVYTCPKCPHEFTIMLGDNLLTPLFFRLKRETRQHA